MMVNATERWSTQIRQFSSALYRISSNTLCHPIFLLLGDNMVIDNNVNVRFAADFPIERTKNIQLFTIRDPFEVESAKSRRFVLIPIEKLKLSTFGHYGTQMMSFLFLSVVRPLKKVSNDTARRVPHALSY